MTPAVGVDGGSDATMAGSSTLVIDVAGGGLGKVVSVPAGIDCSPTCAASFPQSTVVIEGTASPGSSFAGWSGGGCSGTDPCVVALEAVTTVTAHFVVESSTTSYPLAIAKTGVGGGTVSGGGLSCGSSCSSSYPSGTTQTFVATADNSSLFGGWTGCTTTSGTSCAVTFDAAKTISAAFIVCPAVASASPHFVDHAAGVDDPQHGGASGACAFRTLTYALSHGSGAFNLATDTYQGEANGEHLPFLLTGTQSLSCDPFGTGKATLKNQDNQGTYDGIVNFAGTQNSIFDCKIDGGEIGGYCLAVSSSASSAASPHSIAGSDFAHCGNVVINVAANVSNLSITDNTFTLNYLSVLWNGTNTGTVFSNNTFTANNGSDVYCQNPSPGITGSGNVRGGGSIQRGGCQNCPFL